MNVNQSINQSNSNTPTSKSRMFMVWLSNLQILMSVLLQPITAMLMQPVQIQTGDLLAHAIQDTLVMESTAMVNIHYSLIIIKGTK